MNYNFGKKAIVIFSAMVLWAQVQAGGWDDLLQNRIPSADATFRQSLQSSQKTREDMLGESIVSLYHGEPSQAYKQYLDIVLSDPGNPENEAYFRRMSEFQYLTPNYLDLIPVYEKLLSEYKTHPPTRGYLQTVASEYLTKMYYETGQVEKAKELERNLGYLEKWDYVLGPFGKTGASDLNRVFPPERDLSQSSYEGWIHPVVRRPVQNSLYMGQLSLEDYIYPAQGTGYAVTRIHVDSDMDGWMGLSSDSYCKIWNNGKVILIRDIEEFYKTGTSWSKIHLRKGENQVVVKLVSTGRGMNFRLQLLDNNGAPIPQISTSKSSEETFLGNTLSPAQNAETFTSPTFSYARDNSEKVSNQLTRLMLNIVNRNYPEAERILRGWQKKYPNWGYADILLGDLYYRQSKDQPGSSLRLTNQAKEYYEKAKTKMPDSFLPYRGLTWYYINQRQYDTALDFAKQAEKVAANSPYIPTLLGEIYGYRDWDVEQQLAWSKATTLNSRYRQAYFSLANLKQKVGLDSEAQTLLQKAYELDYTDTYALDRLRGNMERQGKYSDSLNWFEKQNRIEDKDYQDYITEGELYEKLAQTENAEKSYSMATVLNPDQPSGYERLGEYQLSKGNNTKAIQLFQEAILRSPKSSNVRDRIIRLLHQSEFYEPYDMNLESIDTTGYDSSHYPRAAAIYLIDLMVTEMHKDGSSRVMIHQAVKILNKQGREKFEELSIPSNARLISARTITANGKIYKPTLITPTSSGKTLSMYAVEEGAILDYCYVYNESGGRTPGDSYSQGLYYFQEKEDPMALSRATYIVPQGVFFQYRNHPLEFLPTISEITGENPAQVYTWEKKKSPGVKDEPFMPSMEDVAVNMFESTYPDWDSVITPTQQEINESEISSDWITETTRVLIAGAKEDRGKIQRIYNFITQKINSSNSGGATVTDTLLIGSGSSRDKTFLGKALLDAARIESEIVLVSTRDIPESRLGFIMPGIYSEPLLHLLKKVDDIEYLDFSSQYRPVGVISGELQGKDALRVTASGYQFFVMPDYSMNEAVSSIKVTVNMLSDGSCEISGLLSFMEDNAVGIRDFLTDPIRKKRVIDEEVNRFFKGIEISTSYWEGIEDLSKPVALGFKGLSKNFLIPQGDGYVFMPVIDRMNLSRMVNSPKREHTLELRNPVAHTEYQMKIHLPENYVISAPDSGTLEITAFGNYILKLTPISEQDWSIERSVLIPKLKIEKEKYPDFLSFCQRVDTVEKRQLRIVRTK